MKMKIICWFKTIVKANKVRREDVKTLKSVIDNLDDLAFKLMAMKTNANVPPLLDSIRVDLIRMFARKGGRA